MRIAEGDKIIVRAEVSAGTDVGRVRPTNQDSLFVDARCGVFAVADGVGGGRAGDVASHVFCEVVREHRSAFEPILNQPLQGTHTRQQAISVMQTIFNVAADRIYRLSESNAKYRGMSTTGVVFALGAGGAVLGHVGDSRAYLVQSDNVRRLTVDHTLAQELLQQGILAEADLDTFPHHNVLARAIGQFPTVRVDTLWLDILPGDNVLMCTDGLYRHLTTEDFHALVGEGVDWAIEQSNARSGDDNLTGVLVRVPQAADRGDRLDTTDKARHLAQLSLFQHLNYQELLLALKSVYEVQFEPGDTVCRESQTAESLYVVVSGRVSVRKGDHELTTLGGGSIFGEIAFMDGGSRSADVVALEPTSMLTIQREDFLALTRAHPTIATKILWAFTLNLADRLRDLSCEYVQSD
jgi:protein phosphatase